MTYSARSVYRDESVAKTYDQNRFRGRVGSLVGQLELRRMLSGLERLNLARDAVVLDVPAGTGRLTKAAVDAGYRAIAMDISAAMLSRVFEQHDLDAAAGYQGAIVGDVERLPLPSGSVDAVVSLRLMGHLPPASKERAIQEMLRVARAGAVVMFSRRSPLLRLKRTALWRLGLRPTASAWFDDSDRDIRSLVERAGGRILGHEDVLSPLTESRAYVIQVAR